jgi:hypothetical protein
MSNGIGTMEDTGVAPQTATRSCVNPGERRRSRGLSGLGRRALLLGALALFIVPGIAQAHHSMGGVSIAVRRVQDVNVSFYKAYGSCNAAGTYCFVQVPMNNRDLKRMQAWCGDTSTVLVVENVLGSTTNVQVCQGSSTWHMRIQADTYASANSFATHDEPVTIEVQGILAP